MEILSVEAINKLRQNARSVVRELGLLNDAFHNIGVTLAERHLLIELASDEAPTMGEIASRLLLEKSTISRLINKAVQKGYIKCITNLDDKRKRHLHLTEKGRKTLHAFEPIAFDQTKNALLTLSREEIKTIFKGMELYSQGLKNSRLKTKANPLKGIQTLPEINKQLDDLGYILKAFEKKDEKKLYEIFREVVDSGSQFPYECNSIEEFHKQFSTLNGQVYVCHCKMGQVVGGFYLKANYSGRSSHIANAAYMIHSDFRGKGIGTLMVQASLHLAKNLGFKAMQFNMVLSENILAIKLYERLGFNIISTIPNGVRKSCGGFQDGYIMHRILDDLPQTPK